MKSSKRFLSLGIGAAVVLVAALLALLQWRGSQPEIVLSDALGRTFAKPLKDTPAVLIGTYSPTKQPGLEMAFNLKTPAAGGEGELQLLFGEYKLTGQVLMTADEQLYVRFPDLSKKLGEVSAKDPQTAALIGVLLPAVTVADNQWIELASDDLAKVSGSAEKLGNCSTAITRLELSSADQKSIGRTFETNPFITVEQTLGTEQKGGQSSRGYRVRLRAAETHDFLQAAKNVSSLQAIVEACNLTAEKLGDLPNDLVLDIWVGKRSRKVTALAFGDKLKVEIQSEAEEKTPPQKPDQSISFELIRQKMEKILPIGTSALENL